MLALRVVRTRGSVRSRLRMDEGLKAALGEAHVELWVWKKGAEGWLGPTRSSGVTRLGEGMPTTRFARLDRCAGAFVQTLAAASA